MPTPVRGVASGGPYSPTSAAWGFFAGQTLPDGLYRATIASGAIARYAGNPLPALTFDFHVLRGDADRDRDVDFSDLLTLAQNYGRSGRTFSQGDFHYDGTVDFGDLLALAQRYGANLAAAPSSLQAPETSQRSSSTAARRRTNVDVVDR